MPSENRRQREVGTIVVEVVQLLAEVLGLVLYTLYSIGVALVNLIFKNEPKSVHGEIVLITGAGHGIGKELALAYASQGATVVVWDINEANGGQTVKEISKLGYPKAHFFVCDVANREHVLAVAKEVQTKVGPVNILINNAGIMPTHPLLDHTKQEIERVMNINVMAHFWTIEAFLPTMKTNNYGHIVSLSSLAGVVGLNNLVPYCCSKFAVRGLMEALYQELRQDKKNEIKLTSVYPFMVNTGLCKRPVIRFGNVLPMVEPKLAAKEIMKAQRRGLNEISIPRSIFYIHNFLRLLPLKAQMCLFDFAGVDLESDL